MFTIFCLIIASIFNIVSDRMGYCGTIDLKGLAKDAIIVDLILILIRFL